MIDKSGLETPLFEGFASTSEKRYIFVCNMETGVSRWSKNAVEYFGLPGEYMQQAGLIWAEHVHPIDRDAYLADIEAVFSGKKEEHRIDYRAKNKKGEYIVVTCYGRVIHSEDYPSVFIGTLENHGIMDNVDPVTNLYNIYELEHHLRVMRDNCSHIAMLLIGINDFYEINNSYGYTFGNKVLRTYAYALLKRYKNIGTIFRMDGAKFLICLPNYSIEKVKKEYAEISKELLDGVIVDDIRISNRISAGAVIAQDEYDPNTLHTSLIYAIQRSKRELNGELVFFEEELIGRTAKNVEFTKTIRGSVLKDFQGFYLCYQPIIRAEGETVSGAEALLRWHNEEYGEVPPGLFIPWLENDACFYELGNWIIETALQETMEILKKYPEFVININLAYPQLQNPQFKDSLVRILEKTGYPPQNICLELTERCRTLEKNYLREMVAFIRTLGIKVALDDFGTGFSSLNLLSELSIDTLKIDRLFVRDIEMNVANQAIVKAVTGCASDLDISVCVEGLESREMIDFIKERYPVYSYQGFYFSKPIKLVEFKEKYDC